MKLFKVVSEAEAKEIKKKSRINLSFGITRKDGGSGGYCVLGLPEIAVLLTLLTVYLYLKVYFT